MASLLPPESAAVAVVAPLIDAGNLAGQAQPRPGGVPTPTPTSRNPQRCKVPGGAGT